MRGKKAIKLSSPLSYLGQIKSGNLVLQSHVVEDETVDVGLLLQLLADGLAATVARLAVDADEGGLVAGIVGLERGSKLNPTCSLYAYNSLILKYRFF